MVHVSTYGYQWHWDVVAIKYDIQKPIPFYVAKTCYMLMMTIFVFLEEGSVHAIIVGRTKNIFFYPDRLDL